MHFLEGCASHQATLASAGCLRKPVPVQPVSGERDRGPSPAENERIAPETAKWATPQRAPVMSDTTAVVSGFAASPSVSAVWS